VKEILDEIAEVEELVQQQDEMEFSDQYHPFHDDDEDDDDDDEEEEDVNQPPVTPVNGKAKVTFSSDTRGSGTR
jgi:hypothetical protein